MFFVVFEILVRVAEGKSWSEAILQTIPPRKGAKLKQIDGAGNNVNNKSENNDLNEINESNDEDAEDNEVSKLDKTNELLTQEPENSEEVDSNLQNKNTTLDSNVESER